MMSANLLLFYFSFFFQLGSHLLYIMHARVHKVRENQFNNLNKLCLGMTSTPEFTYNESISAAQRPII